MLHIDGSYREGGGQIIRTALALSALTRIPFRAEKIRHNRPKPGLKHQHLCCINALEKLSDARVKGAQLGSSAIEFVPGKTTHGTLWLDIGTAGSITLLLQSLLLPSMFADNKVQLKIKGGTDTKWSMPIDYFTHVILDHFKDFASIKIETQKRGYYPKGQGFVELSIIPVLHINDFKNTHEFISHLRTSVKRINLTEKVPVFQIRGISSASQILKSADVAKRQATGAKEKIGSFYPVNIEEEYEQTASVGTIITLWTVCKQGKVAIGADALGERGKRAETVGATAAEKLLGVLNSDAVADSHLADNIIPLLALVGGRIKTETITEHIRSNIYVCETFLGTRFKVDKKQNLIEAE